MYGADGCQAVHSTAPPGVAGSGDTDAYSVTERAMVAVTEIRIPAAHAAIVHGFSTRRNDARITTGVRRTTGGATVRPASCWEQNPNERPAPLR
jgi:hypothetical protein